MAPLYRGIGGSFHPHAPNIGAMIIGKATGLPRAAARTVVFASTDIEQAADYAKDADPAYMRLVLPEDDAVINWIPGVRDMTLNFENFLFDLLHSGTTRYHGISFAHVLQDSAGDVMILEQYLSMGRQKRAIGSLVELWLADKSVQQDRFSLEDGRKSSLAEHNGEVWISGRYTLQPVPELLPANRW